jgi:hypothetical protein
MLASLLIAVVWPPALLVPIAGVVVNLLLRIATGRRVFAVVGAFRQVGPLIAAAEALELMVGEDIRPIVGSLHTDLSHLRRLKSVARWVSRDPMATQGNSGHMASRCFAPSLPSVISTPPSPSRHCLEAMARAQLQPPARTR